MWRNHLTLFSTASLTLLTWSISSLAEIPAKSGNAVSPAITEKPALTTPTATNTEIAPDFNEAIDKAVAEDRTTPADTKMQIKRPIRNTNPNGGRAPASKKKHKGSSGKAKKKKKRHH